MRLVLILMICFTLVSISACPDSENTSVITLEDFGFAQLKVENQNAYGKRPLLVILVNHKNSDFTWHYTREDGSIDDEYYRDLIWSHDRYRTQNIEDYFTNLSYGQFTWEKVDNGIQGPYDLSDDIVIDPENDHMLGIISNSIIEQMDAEGFNFARFDTNLDGVVDNAELALFIIDNAGDFGGGKRSRPACVTAFNSNNISICLDPAAASHGANFATVAHELSHLLGTKDIYGSACNSFNFTLMSCTGALSFGDTQIFHLDPWHKMVLGWITPRLYEFTEPENIDELQNGTSLGEGSCAVIEAAQYQAPGASIEQSPLLFYFKGINARAFFMLEYRTRDGYVDDSYNYDSGLPSNGLAIWQVMTKLDNPTELESVPALNEVKEDIANFMFGAPDGMRNWVRLWNYDDGVIALKWLDGTDIGLRLKISPMDIHNPRKIEIEWGMGRLPNAKILDLENSYISAGQEIMLNGKFGIEKRSERRVILVKNTDFHQGTSTELEITHWSCNSIKVKIPTNARSGQYRLIIMNDDLDMIESSISLNIL